MEPEPHQSQGKPEQSRFGGLHIRTFEAELLISGAVVFGLLQVAPHITRFFDETLVRLEGYLRVLADLGISYLTLVIYGLIGAFLIHLTLRAFWIGLVGLESVFPGGIRWDRVKAGGPFFIRYARQKMGPLAQTIDRVDDLCSLIFSFGFMIVIVFLYSVVVLTFSAIGGFLVSWVFFGGRFPAQVFWVLLGTILGLQLLVTQADRLLGPHVRDDGAVGRTIAFAVRCCYAISPLRWNGPIQLTLGSNASNAKVAAAIFVVMIGLAMGMMGISFAQSGKLRFDSLLYFPASLREQGIDPRHYRDLRPADTVEPKNPSIQSDVVEDPYLKLVIPYYPRRHNALIRERCPDVEPFRSAGFSFGRGEPADGATTRPVVDCMASLFTVELDGVPIDDFGFEFTREPGSNLEGIVTYIAMSELAPGRHQLVVIAPPRRPLFGDDNEPDPVRHVIPFRR